jgi:hypothetical protein
MTTEGNAVDPFHSINEAITNPRLKPGQTINLLAGTHRVPNSLTLANVGLIKSYDGPLAATINLTGAQVADGYGDATAAQNNLYLNVAAQRIEDCVISSQPLTRTTPTRGLYPLGMGRLWVRAASPSDGSEYASLKCCVVGNIIDVGSYTNNAGGVVAEDSIFYDNGWDATESVDGEHFYTQNNSASPTKIFRRNLFGRCFGLAFQLYSESAPRNWHILIVDGTFLSTLYASAGQERNDVTYRRLCFWKAWLSLGGGDTANTDLVVEDCYVAGQSITVSSSNGTTITGNTVVKLDGVGEMGIGTAQGVIEVDGNHYYGGVVLKYNNAIKTWAEWQALGFDANGTYSADLPTETAAFVVASDGTGYVLGQVTVYNWTSANTVTVDLAALGVTNGQQVKLRSIDDPLVDVRALTVSGTSVTIDMTIYDADTNPTGRTISTPIGHDVPLGPAQDIRFGAWRVEMA